MGSEVYDLDQYGAELLLSKGFTVLTPYVGAGVVHSEGSLDSSLGRTFEDSETRGVIYGGVTLNLLAPQDHRRGREGRGGPGGGARRLRSVKER